MHPVLSASIFLQPDLALTGLFLLIFTATAIYGSAVPQGNQRWWACTAVMAVLILAALRIETPLPRLILLDFAALAAVALVWSQPGLQAKQAGKNYLFIVLISITCTAVGLALAGQLGGEQSTSPSFPFDRWAAALLMIGFAMKLALVPFYFWLPGIAGITSPMTSGLIIATLDMAEFGELLTLRQVAPWVFTDHAVLWIILALLSMFGGALLALAQHDIKRMLAFSTIDDMGYLLLGVLIGSEISLTGAVIGVASHAICKILMFGAVGIAEKSIGEPVNLDCRGLSTYFPISGAMFVTGAIGILGIPPLLGFAGRWRLYLAGIQYGGAGLGIAMALATALALLYYVRAIHKVWFGQAPGIAAGLALKEPRTAAVTLIFLAVLLLVLGLFPGMIQAVI